MRGLSCRTVWFQGARGRENFKVCFLGEKEKVVGTVEKWASAMSDVAQRPGKMRLRIDHGISDPGVIGTMVRAVWVPHHGFQPGQSGLRTG